MSCPCVCPFSKKKKLWDPFFIWPDPDLELRNAPESSQAQLQAIPSEMSGFLGGLLPGETERAVETHQSPPDLGNES